MSLTRMRRAIRERDHNQLELLRTAVTADDVSALASDWSPSLDRATKDAYLALLMDQTVARHPELAPMMLDGLDAPSIEVRAYAACSLLGDFDVFTRILYGEWPAERLAAARAQLGARP
jgi:hypothetical protein